MPRLLPATPYTRGLLKSPSEAALRSYINLENLGDLYDVLLTAAAAGELLVFNGSQWVNANELTITGGNIYQNANLATRGNYIVVENDTPTIQGVLGPADPALGGGIGIAYSADGTFNEDDGAVVVRAGLTEVFGTSAIIDGLKHTTDGGRQVYVGESGVLYAVDPPDPGWLENATDANDYDIGGGTGINPWVRVTDLQITFPEDVNPGDRLDIAVQLDVLESGGRSGAMDIGFGTNLAQPGASAFVNQLISAGFDGFVNVNITTSTVTQSAGNTLEIWARAVSGSHPNFDLDLTGTVAPHELTVSTPGEGGSGGGGAELTIVNASSNYTAKDGELVLCDVTGGDFTLTAPAPLADNARFGFILAKRNAGQTLTLDHNLKLIGGRNGPTFINVEYWGAIFQYEHATAVWHIVSDFCEDTYIKVEDAKPQGTEGGTLSAQTWNTRELTTIRSDTGENCTLATNQFTLDAGRYELAATAPSFEVNRNALRLYNASDTAAVFYGGNVLSFSQLSPNADLKGSFEITAAKAFELQHWAHSGYAGQGGGVAKNSGQEIYSVVELTKKSPFKA